MSAKVPAKGHTRKHTTSKKHEHHASKKHHPAHHKKAATEHGAGHHVTAKAKHATHAKARGYAVGELLPVCAFEALAMSLRLAGQLVDDDEVAWLWELAGSPPFGAALPAALNAARLHGLAGCRPRWERLERLGPVRVADEFRLPRRDDPALPLGPFEDFFASDAHGLFRPVAQIDAPEGGRRLAWRDLRHLVVDGAIPALRGDGDAAPVIRCDVDAYGDGLAALAPPSPCPPYGGLAEWGGQAAREERKDDRPVHGLILGIDVPGPHCVLATADGWWSWGELHDPWPARIEEAWAVSWS